MPGPKPTPSSTFYLTDPRTLALLAIIVSLGGVVVYLLNR